MVDSHLIWHLSHSWQHWPWRPWINRYGNETFRVYWSTSFCCCFLVGFFYKYKSQRNGMQEMSPKENQSALVSGV